MKTKKLFLMAAMLLTSMCAFAQSESNEPLKGDVNGDGKVDVADITAIVAIIMKNGGQEETTYWFSAGTTPITQDNYTTANNAIQVTSYENEYYVTAETRSYIYILVASNKSVTLIEPTLNAPIDLIEMTDINIPNYTVYRSFGKCMGTNIPIRISDKTFYYYYAGWTLPTVDNVDTIINETYPVDYGSSETNTAGMKTTAKSEMNYLNNTLYNANEKTYYYVLVPTGHGIYDSLNNNVSNSAFTSQGTITVGNQTHTIYKSNASSRYINAIIIK